MGKVISSTELQKKTRQAIDWARMNREAIIIETYGKPMAVLVSYEDYVAYKKYKAQQAGQSTNSQIESEVTP